MASTRTFVHVPRTGGLALRATWRGRVWHDGFRAPPLCNVSVLLRNETERYCSEWQFYGLDFFARGKSVKAWRPAGGWHRTMAQFAADPSTHDTQVKLLSGCNLYDRRCVGVGPAHVRDVLARVASGCVRIERPPTLVAHASHRNCTRAEYALAHAANPWDRMLLRELAHARDAPAARRARNAAPTRGAPSAARTSTARTSTALVARGSARLARRQERLVQ